MRSIWLFLAAFVVALALQAHRGAYTYDLGGDPDEPAHAVTSLMLRELAMEPFRQSPMGFVKAYYERFSKVALGHYPPGFYLIGAASLLIQKSVATLLILQAAIHAGMVVLLARMGRHFLPHFAAAICALSWLFLAQVQRYGACVMADQLVALLTLASAYAFYCYLESKRIRHALMFGLLAAFTILTKGSGWCLALLPALTFLLIWDFSWLKRLSLWTAVIPVVLLAIPWQYLSSKISSEGFTGIPFSEYYLQALPFFVREVPSNLGWPITFIFLLGWLLGVSKNTPIEVRRLLSVLLATLMVVIAIMSIIPVGMTARYLIPMFGPALLLSGYAIKTLWFKFLPNQRGVSFALLTFLIASIYPTFGTRDVNKRITGFEAAYDHAVATFPKNSNLLILSDPRGEGAVIARGAFTTTSPTHRVARGSKVLAKMDWMGRDYVAATHSEDEMLALLEAENFGAVLIDLSTPQKWVQPYQSVLQAALSRPNSGYQLNAELSVQRTEKVYGQIQIWIKSPQS